MQRILQKIQRKIKNQKKADVVGENNKEESLENNVKEETTNKMKETESKVE